MKSIRSIAARLLALGTAAALALSLTACGVKIQGMSMPADLVLEKGTTRQLELQFDGGDKASTPEVAEAAGKLTLTWTSSDEAVVTVDDTGLATAVGAGEADVTVTAADSDLEAATHIKVVILPTGVQAPESLELDLNGETTKALGAVMTPEDATDVKLAYESSDETVATVDEAGNVTAVGQGTCTITTTIVADAPAPEEEVDSAMLVVPENAKAETKVTVGKAVESIALDAAQGTLTVDGSRTIGATVLPEDATDKTLTWTSSDGTVATVDGEGTVTAKAAGNATITARHGDVTASYKLTVQLVTCSYCGQTGHTSSSCPVKAADQQAAAAAAQAAAQQQAQQQAAAQAAQQQAAQQAAQQAQQQQQQAQPAQPSGDNGGGSSGGSPVEGDWDAGFGLSSGIDWTQDQASGGETETIITP